MKESERPIVDDELRESVVSATRTSLGDTLRSIVYFTPTDFEVLYVRSDLYQSEDAVREAKGQLVEFEQVGFGEVPVRTAIAEQPVGSDIGPYEFTVRFHEDGFVVRVIQDEAGVLFTADSMDVRAFEDAAMALRRLLSEE